MQRNWTHIVIDGWHRIVCRVLGHDWKIRQGFPVGQIRTCLRCPAIEVDWR